MTRGRFSIQRPGAAASGAGGSNFAVHRWTSSAGWAVAIVTTSIGAAYAFDGLGLQWLAGIALAPVYPVPLVVVAAAGGFHAVSGESRWMLVTAVLSVVVWWAIIKGWRMLRTRYCRRPID